jgi:hypothetical protein
MLYSGIVFGMPSRRLGLSNYNIVWDARPLDRREAARLVISQFKGDVAAMRDLRAVLLSRSLGIPNSRLTDDEVLDQAAKLFASGDLSLISGEVMPGGGAGQRDSASTAPQAPAASPAVRSSSQQPENATLPSNTNGAQQAAALAAAAQSGAPFCAH